MKKLITICLLMAVSYISNAQEQKEYYDNGNIKYVGKYINGKGNGEWKFYHENGQLSHIGNFIDNLSTGEWKFYNEKGELIIKRLYDVNGKETAKERIEYYENGQLKEVGNYAGYERNGENKTYYENGQLKAIGRFTYGNGNGEFKFYHENGQLKEIGYYIDGVANGEFKYYYENGQLKEFGNMSNGKKIGEWKYFDEIKKAPIEMYTSIQNSTQVTQFKDARSWKVLSSLMGATLENAKNTLKNYGMAEIANTKDPDLGLHFYGFAKTNSKDPKEEPAYYLCFNESNKVEMITSGYVFTSIKAVKEDLSQIEKDLESSGYNLLDKKTEKHSGLGEKWTSSIYFFNKPNQKNQVLIMYDKSSSSFNLLIGQKKYLDKIVEINQ